MSDVEPDATSDQCTYGGANQLTDGVADSSANADANAETDAGAYTGPNSGTAHPKSNTAAC